MGETTCVLLTMPLNANAQAWKPRCSFTPEEILETCLRERESKEELISALLYTSEQAEDLEREYKSLSMRYNMATREKNYYEVGIIQKEYQRLKLIKKKIKAKERRVLAAAKTDVRVREAVSEFVQRRNNMRRASSSSRLNSFLYN